MSDHRRDDRVSAHDRRYRRNKKRPAALIVLLILAVAAVIVSAALGSRRRAADTGAGNDGADASQGVAAEEPGHAGDAGTSAGSGAPEDPDVAGTAATQETAPETEAAPHIQTVTISAAGDIALGTLQTHGYEGSLREMAEENGTAYFLQNVRHVFEEDDMTLVNFEAVLTDSTEARTDQEFLIRGEPAWIAALPEGSVEAVGFSNNHDWDYLQRGWDDTVAAFESAGLVWSAEDHYGYYTTDEGITIGMVSVNKLNRLDEARETLYRGITALREEGVDLVIAYIHTGVEMQYYPQDYEVQMDHDCIDWGADLVLNTHTHCLRGIEQYQGRFICYGLGNFCFGANRNPSDKDTMIYQQTWTFVDGVLQPDIDVHVEPCSISSTPGRNDYCPTTLTGSEYDRVLANINAYSAQFGTVFDANGDYGGE